MKVGLQARLCLAVVASTALVGSMGGPAAALAPGAGMRVFGNLLTLDGRPFTPRGFTLIGALAPPGCTQPNDAAATTHFSIGELDALRDTWHANTVRFQVSQAGLSGADWSTYLSTVTADVALAEQEHLQVIVSMNVGKALNCLAVQDDLPTAATVTAWNHLAPAFDNDPDVAYELFNEPVVTPGTPPGPDDPIPPAVWNQWRDGGAMPDPNNGEAAVGEQELVDTVRGLGATNVLIADGLNKAGRLQGVPALTDSTVPANIAYAVHPYYYADGPAGWDVRFGYLSSTVPVIATEWNYTTSSPDQCGTWAEQQAPTLLAYLAAHSIGVLGYAGDNDVVGDPTAGPKALMADWSWTPNSGCPDARGPGGDYLSYADAQRAYPARVWGTDRYATSAEVAAASGYQPGVGVLYVAAGTDAPDALSAAPVAGRDSDPLLLIDPTRGLAAPPNATTPTELLLRWLQPQRIVALGGKAVLGDDLLAQLAPYTSGSVTRLWGPDRYATSAAISKVSYSPDVAAVYVAAGTDVPDALSGAPAAGRGGDSLLLVTATAIPAPIAAELTRLHPGRIVVLGGTAVVQANVATALQAYTTGTVTRLAGIDRYATSAAISQATYPTDVATVYVANGRDEPDPLSAAPAAGTSGVPILLIDPSDPGAGTASDAQLTRLHPHAAVLLGGTAVLPDTLRQVLTTFVHP